MSRCSRKQLLRKWGIDEERQREDRAEGYRRLETELSRTRSLQDAHSINPRSSGT